MRVIPKRDFRFSILDARSWTGSEAGSFAAALLVLGAGSLTWFARSLEAVRAESVVRRVVANRIPGKPIRITVDPSSASDEPGDPWSILRLKAPNPETPPATESIPASSGLRITANSDSEELPVFASRLNHGGILIVANHSLNKSEFNFGVRLSPGVYTLERATFPVDKPETNPPFERLQSLIPMKTVTVWRPGALRAGTAAIYRWTDCRAAVFETYKELKRSLHALHEERAEDARRIGLVLNTCEDNVAAIQDRFHVRSDDLCKYIHRALLGAGHAQSLARNARVEGRITGRCADDIADRMNRFEDALSALSAAYMNLIPALEVKPAADSDPSARTATVSLANLGGRTVTAIRITPAMPNGGRIWPPEPAMFSSLGPGQTVRATFSLRLPSADDAPPIQADISYFAGKAPACLHLDGAGAPGQLVLSSPPSHGAPENFRSESQ